MDQSKVFWKCIVKNTLTVYNSYICFKQIKQKYSSEREYFFTRCTEKGKNYK